VVKMPSAWSVDWKQAFAAAKPLGFMEDAARDALGTAFKDYSWWDDAKAGNALPASATVYHYHPIALVLALAYAS